MKITAKQELKIGEFTLYEIDPPDPHCENQIWIEKEGGERGTFNIADVEKVIAEFFEENF